MRKRKYGRLVGAQACLIIIYLSWSAYLAPVLTTDGSAESRPAWAIGYYDPLTNFCTSDLLHTALAAKSRLLNHSWAKMCTEGFTISCAPSHRRSKQLFHGGISGAVDWTANSLNPGTG